jgi:hypothetical protein
MPIDVYLVRRKLKKRRRNGQWRHHWVLRWADPVTGKWCCESTGTADRTEAEQLKKAKWASLNVKDPANGEPPPETRPTWEDCRAAIKRAMEADNLRQNYIDDALLNFDLVQKTFPSVPCPAHITADMANEFKRRRAVVGGSPWTLKGDLATIRAVFGKWLVRECGLLKENPFAGVRPPRCDNPEVRIVLASETQALFGWLSQRWCNWRLPLVYLEVAALLGWRATEIASIRTEDILDEGYLRVDAATSKTRRAIYGWLPEGLHNELRLCAAGDWAFGRFSVDL